MAVLQIDSSVSCHVFHPSMKNSQIHKPLMLKAILRPIFYLGASFVLVWGVVLLWVFLLTLSLHV